MFVLVESRVGFGEGERCFFGFEREIGPFFFGTPKLAFRLVAYLLSEVLFKL